MKIPMKPPLPDFSQFVTISGEYRPITEKGDYLHWDKLRHLTPPAKMSSDQWWALIKLARKAIYKKLPFKDKNDHPFVLSMPDSVLHQLHSIDRNLSNTMQQNSSVVLNTQMRDTYLIQSLIEEAITSSQLEGASTTRKIAKEMLQTNRKPRNLSEKMIHNNYQAMQFVREMKDEKLTPKIILELHRILTTDTLDDPAMAGCLRTSDDIHVWDNVDQILHTPPKAAGLEKRMIELCKFANSDQDDFFIHPVIKAITLHFMLVYDHPFIDGNGRTARALFYWSMAHQNYWLMEFISISEIIKRSPVQYARAYLYTETDDNDLTYFIVHQLGIIINAIDALYAYINKQNQEIKEIEQLLSTNRILRNKLNYRQILLIKNALKHPDTHYLIEAHRQSHNVTYDTARTDLLNLAALNLLIKKKAGKAFSFIVPRDLRKKISKI